MIAKLRARWPAIRASLIALAMAIGLLEGCPVTAPEQAPAFARPVVEPADAARRWLLGPVRWIGADLVLTQRWALFTGASRNRFRLWVEGRTPDGEWRILFRAGDAERVEYADPLQYRRVRGMFSPRGQRPRGQYPAFAQWIARRVLADHPELVAARARLEHIVIGDGVFEPTGKFILEQTVVRGAP